MTPPGPTEPADPFGTAALRASTLQTWRSSPTRLREDTAAESDLVTGGYRDRVLTELAQNAADAADRAHVAGELNVQLVGRELRVANVGAPLDADGVTALAALRASGKTSGVGRFGVGFTAVLSVTDAPMLLSRNGSVQFSADRTRHEVGGDVAVPVLRLLWPAPGRPVEPYDTEVVLPLREDVDAPALLAQLAAQAPQLLLELDALQRIIVGPQVVQRTQRELGGDLSELQVDGRTWWQHRRGRARWLVELADAEVVIAAPDVLHAPTRTDEQLSLPALLVADVDLAPDRRRLMPGASLAGLAQGYPELVAALAPAQRTRLVPLPGFPRSATDAALRNQVLTALGDYPWLPSAAGADITVRAAVVLDQESTALVGVLTDVVPGLLIAELSAAQHAPAISALQVPRLGLGQIADAVAGLDRAPQWWQRLYAALEPLVHDRADVQELAALGVPLVDGRTVLGAHTAVLLEGVSATLPGLRVVHPGAAHPLLLRLGAVPTGAAQLLADPTLVRASTEVDDGDAPAIAEALLSLVAAAGARPGEYPWLGELLLTDDTGELRAADELLLPGAPLIALLAADAPFGTVSPGLLQRHGAGVLRAVGVGWGFSVLSDPDATGPDHDLAEEAGWWDEQPTAPTHVLAVRDLELVDPGAWPQALALLHAEPDTLAAITEPGGYTGWWLRRHATIGGLPLGHWRSPQDATFAGLLDEVPVSAVSAGLLAASQVDSPAVAELLLERLADPARHPTPAVVARTHALLAAALTADVLDLAQLRVPARVRAIDGSVVDADTAVVLDRAWLAAVVAPQRLVLGPLHSDAEALADVLDIGLASEQGGGQVVGDATARAWAQVPEVVLLCAQLGAAVPAGQALEHPDLQVRFAGAQRSVPWWVEGTGRVHVGPGGWPSALAHTLTSPGGDLLR